jgi:hypothetical protein
MSIKPSFNLLKPIHPPKTLWDKVYDWVLNRARIVFLITEILIAIAFFGKVIQDTDAKNKEREIERLNGELAFYQTSLEPEFRLLHLKDQNYIAIWNASSDYSSVLNEIYSFFPSGVNNISIKIEGNKVSLVGNEDLSILLQIEAKFKASQTFVENSAQINTLVIEKEEILEGTGQYVLSAILKDVKRLEI